MVSANIKIVELLRQAQEEGVSLVMNEGTLQLKVRKGSSVPPDLMNVLKEHKEAIIRFLQDETNAKMHQAPADDNILEKQERNGKIPLSFSQESAWIVNKMQGDVVHRMPVILRFKGPLNKEALRFALKEIVNRHEVLRTVIREDDGKAYQEVRPADLWQMEYAVFPARELSLDDYLMKELDRKFDISNDHMIRGKLIEMGKDEYILVLVIHHIAFDGWSQAIFSDEVVALYKSYDEDRHPDQQPLTIQYADYAIWQNKYFQTAAYRQKEEYWKDLLTGVNSVGFRPDRHRSAAQNTAGEELNTTLNADLGTALKKMAKDEDVTLYMLLLSAFYVLVYRYTGERTICVGTPVANRTYKEIQPLIGYFVNTLPMKAEIKGRMTFRDLLVQVKQRTLEAYNCQEVPLEKIINNVVRQRALTIHPLFQMLFVLQNNQAGREIAIDGLTIDRYDPVNFKVAEFDITFTVADSIGGLNLHVSFRKDLYLPETIQRILQNYETLLKGIVSNPDTDIDKVTILHEAQREDLVQRFSKEDKVYTADVTLVELFQQQVIRTPEAVALVFKDMQLTYRQLNEQANALAHYLVHRKHIVKGARVGVCIDRSPEMIVALLAVMKAGAAYVAIPPQFPLSRIKMMAEDAGTDIIITDDHSAQTLRELGLGLLDIKTEWSEIMKESNQDLPFLPGQSDLIYLVYTSGSTGKPKAVMTEHRHLITYLLPMIGLLGIDDRSSFLNLASYSFDGSCLEIYLPFIVGASVVLVEQAAVTDGFLLQEIINTNAPTFVHGTPSALNMLLDSGWKNDINALILSGGEPMKPRLLQRLQQISSNRIFNLYGPTESTLYATIKELTSPDNISVGRPIPNYSIFIVDQEGALVPVGVEGEVLIGGKGLARGYLNQPQLTDEKFIENHIEKQGRLYRTGDLGRWNHNGEIDLSGRRDNQVKIRGFRIEINEIEACLMRSEMVKECAVLVMDNTEGDKYLVAYVIPVGGFDKDALLLFLGRELPGFMIPAFIVETAVFRLNSNGKLDKSLLPPINREERKSSASVMPLGEKEQQLMDIWRDILSVADIGPSDNFFERGGNSLLAVRLMARIKKQFDIKLPVTSLFENPTISLLAGKLSINDVKAGYPLVTGINTDGANVPVFCAPAVGGEPVSFYELARLLGTEQPLYAFSARGLDAVEQPYASIEEMARDYVKEMRRIYPSGPYVIAGYSFGGRTAYEMALQLKQEGAEVRHLIIFDAYAPDKIVKDYNGMLPATYTEWLQVMANIINHSFSLPENKRIVPDFHLLKGKDEEEQFKMFFEMVNGTGIGITEYQLKGHINVYIRNSGISYVPASFPVDIPVTLFRSILNESYAFDQQHTEKRKELMADVHNRPDYGWSDFTTAVVNTCDLKCSHLDLMSKPYINTIAERIKTFLS
jgi:amino acid adenylation domain-containing protein